MGPLYVLVGPLKLPAPEEPTAFVWYKEKRDGAGFVTAGENRDGFVLPPEGDRVLPPLRSVTKEKQHSNTISCDQTSVTGQGEFLKLVSGNKI